MLLVAGVCLDFEKKGLWYVFSHTVLFPQPQTLSSFPLTLLQIRQFEHMVLGCVSGGL